MLINAAPSTVCSRVINSHWLCDKLVVRCFLPEEGFQLRVPFQYSERIKESFIIYYSLRQSNTWWFTMTTNSILIFACLTIFDIRSIILGTYGAFRSWTPPASIITLGSRQSGRHFPDDIFISIFLNENIRNSISLKFVPKGPINNIPSLVQIMACRRPGDRPLSEPMMVRSLVHKCITRLQWVKFEVHLDDKR